MVESVAMKLTAVCQDGSESNPLRRKYEAPDGDDGEGENDDEDAVKSKDPKLKELKQWSHQHYKGMGNLLKKKNSEELDEEDNEKEGDQNNDEKVGDAQNGEKADVECTNGKDDSNGSVKNDEQ